MKQLGIIQFKDLTIEEIAKFEVRHAARAIVFDSENKIGILYVGLHNYYKLPGGGIEAGEDVVTALKRECLEEIGCNITVTSELGEIIEYRDEGALKQHSYYYLAKLVGEKGEPDFTEKEKARNFQIKWVDLDEAIRLIKGHETDNIFGNFIKTRDLMSLVEAKKILDV